MYKGHWAEEVVCVVVPDVIVVNFLLSDRAGEENDRPRRTWWMWLGISPHSTFFFFFVVLPLFIIMDNIKEHLDSTRYFLISFEVECCCWLYFTFYENCAAH